MFKFGVDIQTDIKIHKSKIKIYVAQKRYLLRVILQIPDKGAVASSLDRDYEKLQVLEANLVIEKDIIKTLEDEYESMLEDISKLKNIDLKVKYMRDINGFTLQEVAEFLNYNLVYIRQVSQRNKKRASATP